MFVPSMDKPLPPMHIFESGWRATLRADKTRLYFIWIENIHVLALAV